MAAKSTVGPGSAQLLKRLGTEIASAAFEAMCGPGKLVLTDGQIAENR